MALSFRVSINLEKIFTSFEIFTKLKKSLPGISHKLLLINFCKKVYLSKFQNKFQLTFMEKKVSPEIRRVQDFYYFPSSISKASVFYAVCISLNQTTLIDRLD